MITDQKSMDRGREWADRVYAEKLADPAKLPRLGPGFTDELRAARAVQSIADRKLYAGHARAGNPDRTYNPDLSRGQRDFWRGVLQRAGELCIAADDAIARRAGYDGDR